MMEMSDHLNNDYRNYYTCSSEEEHKSQKYPDYCRTLTIKDANGAVKELVFPKALDLDRPKRARTTFSPEQLYHLEREFHRNQYLVGKERTELAKTLRLSETQVALRLLRRVIKIFSLCSIAVCIAELVQQVQPDVVPPEYEASVKVWFQNRRTKYKRDKVREAEVRDSKAESFAACNILNMLQQTGSTNQTPIPSPFFPSIYSHSSYIGYSNT